MTGLTAHSWPKFGIFFFQNSSIEKQYIKWLSSSQQEVWVLLTSLAAVLPSFEECNGENGPECVTFSLLFVISLLPLVVLPALVRLCSYRAYCKLFEPIWIVSYLWAACAATFISSSLKTRNVAHWQTGPLSALGSALFVLPVSVQVCTCACTR